MRLRLFLPKRIYLYDNMDTQPSPQIIREAKKIIRNPKSRGRTPAAVQAVVLQLKKEQKVAAKKAALEAAEKVVELPTGPEPNYEKLEKFAEIYLTNGGNITQAALAVSPSTSILNASGLGQAYLRTLLKHGVGQAFLEKKGWGHGKFMEVLMKNMETSRKTDWWDRGMKLSGYGDFISPKNVAPQQVVNIMGSQKRDMDDFGFVEGEVVTPEPLEPIEPMPAQDEKV